jgi:hypothetical protein
VCVCVCGQDGSRLSVRLGSLGFGGFDVLELVVAGWFGG